MRIGNDWDARFVQNTGEPLNVGHWIEAHCAAMMGKGATMPTSLERLKGHHFQCAQTGVAGIVKQHGNVFVEFFS
jgi:hypothetical protein